jgi:HD-GYP domain-containing protein (c-di-GMP phosphodiesterase class II)
VLAVLAGTISGEAGGPGPLIQRLFNSSIAVLRVLGGTAAHAALLGLGPDGLMTPAAMLSAAVVMQATATLLVLGITSVQLRENPLRRAWMPQRETLLIESTLGLTGILTAVAAREHVWALLALAAPLAIAQRAIRDGVALRAQTRRALEELADIVDMRDHYTFEHSRRVAELARATAKKLSLDSEMVELVTMAGRVHDVGKIGIKSTVLMKPGKLTDREWQEMRSHPVVGARLIGSFPQFAHGRGLVLHHHERYDGKGYPNGLSGDRIPLGARILAVADAWDAMTSHRAYRKALDLASVRAEMERCGGTQFDPVILSAFLKVLDERPDLAMPAVHEPQEVDQAPAALVQPSAENAA